MSHAEPDSAQCGAAARIRFVLNIDQHGVPLIESGAARVLAAEAHRESLLHQAGKGERLGHAVVERLLAGAHLLALLEQLLHLGMDVETVGIRGQAFGEFSQFFAGDAGRLLVLRLCNGRRNSRPSISEDRA
jgi:hypothetical protein